MLEQHAPRLDPACVRRVPERRAPGLVHPLDRSSRIEQPLHQFRLRPLRHQHQRARAMLVPGIRFRMGRQERSHDARVPALGRSDERRLRVVQPPVGRDAVREHGGDDVLPADANRIEERRVSATVGPVAFGAGREQRLHFVSRAAERRHREDRQPVRGEGIGIGAACQEGAQQLRVLPTGGDCQVRPTRVQVALGSLHRGRLTVGGHDRVAVQRRGSLLAQPRCDARRPADLGKIERRPFLSVARRDARARRKQLIDHGERAAHDGMHQRGIAALVRRVDVRVRREHGIHGGRLAAARGDHERRRAILIGCIHRRAAADEERHGGGRGRLSSPRERASAELIARCRERRVHEGLEARHIAVTGGEPQRFPAHRRIGQLCGRQKTRRRARASRGRALLGRGRAFLGPRIHRIKEAQLPRAGEPARRALGIGGVGILQQCGEAERRARAALVGGLLEPGLRGGGIARSAHSVEIEDRQQVLGIRIASGGQLLQLGRGRCEVLESD